VNSRFASTNSTSGDQRDLFPDDDDEVELEEGALASASEVEEEAAFLFLPPPAPPPFLADIKSEMVPIVDASFFGEEALFFQAAVVGRWRAKAKKVKSGILQCRLLSQEQFTIMLLPPKNRPLFHIPLSETFLIQMVEKCFFPLCLVFFSVIPTRA
jgi:hypothetical protein